LIQFEDFTNDHAFPLLARYRDRVLCFNDDIQGTGGVALAGLLGALRLTRTPLSEQRVVFYGAGSAAIGIADMIVAGMIEAQGITPAEARQRFWLLDSKGLVTRRRAEPVADHKLPYARDDVPMDALLDVVREAKPTVLMGLSGQPGSFTEAVIREMASHVPKPIIFALSNPTSKAECTAEQAYRWTDGEAIFASGSPFDPVTLNGRRLVPGQGNNMFVFPGVGLGATACEARTVTDPMFYAAAKSLAQNVSAAELERGTVYPDLTRIRQISRDIAVAVCGVAEEAGLANRPLGEDARAVIEARMYEPCYRGYISPGGADQGSGAADAAY
jgi:malate dehydrogenase (oxaloacetate-decarboxylating)(NADP+)